MAFWTVDRGSDLVVKKKTILIMLEEQEQTQEAMRYGRAPITSYKIK